LGIKDVNDRRLVAQSLRAARSPSVAGGNFVYWEEEMKLSYLVGGLAIAGMISGCASPMPMGALYTELKLPVTATGTAGRKEGTAECQSVLGLVATGDCSIETAKKNGGISKVSAVDWEAKNILGILGQYKIHVFGE
jgi:hypothetical protein